MLWSNDEIWLADIHENEGKTNLVYKKHREEEKKKRGMKDNNGEKIGRDG